MKNERILLVNRPKGMPQKSDFRFEEASLPEMKNDEVLVKTLYLSVDPYMRGRISGFSHWNSQKKMLTL
jgi:NADPH:quinone reductase